MTKFSFYWSFTANYFFKTISSCMLVLSIRIVLDCFSYFENCSILISRLPFAVSVTLNLFNVKWSWGFFRINLLQLQLRNYARFPRKNVSLVFISVKHVSMTFVCLFVFLSWEPANWGFRLTLRKNMQMRIVTSSCLHRNL